MELDDECDAQTDITLFVQHLTNNTLSQGAGQECSVKSRGIYRSFSSIYRPTFRRPREDDESAQQAL